MPSQYIRYQGKLYRKADAPLRDPREQARFWLLPEPGHDLTHSQQISMLKHSVKEWNSLHRNTHTVAHLQYADLSGLNLRGVWLAHAKLQYATLQDTDLRDANLRGASLQITNLNGADLRGADLRGADMVRTELNGADLRGAWLQYASFIAVDLQSTKLQGAQYNNDTYFPSTFDPKTAGMILVP